MEKLLVTMTGHDPVQKLIPCLETLVRPGMTVIFLFQYPVDSGSYFRDHRITVESARHATAVGRNIFHRYDWEAQKELAWRVIDPAARSLRNRGVHVEIQLCSGRLATALKNYSLDKDIHWMVTRFPRPGLIGYLSTKTMVALGWSTYLLCVREEPSSSETLRQRRHDIRRTGTQG
jgi:hypothetical protein